MTDDEPLLQRIGAHARARRAAEDAYPVPENSAADRAAIEARLLAVLRPATTPQTAAPARTPSRRRALWLASPLLAAAAAALLFWPSAAPSELPRYELSIVTSAAAGRSATRAADPRSLRVRTAATSTLVLRPGVPVRSAVTARAYVSRRGALQVLAVQIASDELGALRLSFDWPAGITAAGAELVVVAGDSALLQQRAAALAAGPSNAGPGFQRWSLALRE